MFSKVKTFLVTTTAVVVVCSTSVFAEPLRMSADATRVLFAESAKPGFYLRDEGNYQPWAYNATFARNFESALPGVTMVKRSDGTVHMNLTGEYNGQCVAFVKAMTGDRTYTGKWKKGQQVRPGAVIPPNTAIATFDANGRYSGHTGFYLFPLGDRIIALDQNWRTYGGKPGNSSSPGNIAMHSIPFTGKGGVGDAYSYYVIEK